MSVFLSVLHRAVGITRHVAAYHSQQRVPTCFVLARPAAEHAPMESGLREIVRGAIDLSDSDFSRRRQRCKRTRWTSLVLAHSH